MTPDRRSPRLHDDRRYRRRPDHIAPVVPRVVRLVLVCGSSPGSTREAKNAVFVGWLLPLPRRQRRRFSSPSSSSSPSSPMAASSRRRRAARSGEFTAAFSCWGQPEAQPRGIREMRGDPGALPTVWDIGHLWGSYHADTCREICCSRKVLTFQVPQGNLEMMMRILINSAGALCAYTSLGGDPKAMARLLYNCPRVRELSGPGHPPRL